IVMLNLFQHPFWRPRRPSRTWTLKRVQGDGLPIISPASAALIKLASEPASNARSPSLAIIGRWLGARLPVTAIWIAIELKLAKPHSAKVTIARLRSLSAAAGPAAL